MGCCSDGGGGRSRSGGGLGFWTGAAVGSALGVPLPAVPATDIPVVGGLLGYGGRVGGREL